MFLGIFYFTDLRSNYNTLMKNLILSFFEDFFESTCDKKKKSLKLILFF